MSRVDELIMIIPVVLNLKGNLEMNLSARLGTAANIGELDKPKARRAIILGNLSLLQVQATVVSFVAALVASGLSRIMPRPAPETSLLEDNSPVVSAVNIMLIGTPIPLIMIIILTAAAIGWTVVTRRNLHVKHLLLEGWVPLFAAMIISCGTGIVLDLFVSRYEGFALLAAVISGLPGNVGSILVSRLSTALHATTYTPPLPSASTDTFVKPPSPHPPTPRLVMITLLCVTFPIEIAFLATLRALGWLHVPFIFLIFSLLFFCVAVVASLFLAKNVDRFAVETQP
ncbi:hypothetical protein EW026_g4516 [Hermanssonia centrifuga]|uniref:SLC41A/MgtE integral membrane domain-containing protein n=1 Tax=Hermanssonia centrifuga TaxID=98765 RepID=A0A4S4KHP1_9APHY|nr:hypothetical protein EW026_g4516 [Hermanssonia centrifuga]